MDITQEESPGPDESCSTQREAIAQEIDRRTVVVEAKILVRQLDTYLELIGAWALDEEGEDAGHSGDSGG